MVRTVPTALAFLFILSPAAVGQDVPSPGDRFALYNLCAPMGLVIESLPDDAAATGLKEAQLKALAESRLRAIGLHESDASTFLHVAASRYAVQLRYMKPVIDVASSETETIRTFSRSAEVRDGTAAGVMLEVSKLLDLFLIEYRRVNEPDCAEANSPSRAVRERTVPPPPPREAGERASPAVIEPPSIRSDTPGTEQPGAPGAGPVPGPEDDESRVQRTVGDLTSPRVIRRFEPEYTEKALKKKL